MIQYALETISILRDYIVSERVDEPRLTELQKTLVFAIDRNKVMNRPTKELEALYESILWLKCDIIGYE